MFVYVISHKYPKRETSTCAYPKVAFFAAPRKVLNWACAVRDELKRAFEMTIFPTICSKGYNKIGVLGTKKLNYLKLLSHSRRIASLSFGGP